jgi:prepilin-type processing-associated H-X9-DG protein
MYKYLKIIDQYFLLVDFHSSSNITNFVFCDG